MKHLFTRLDLLDVINNGDSHGLKCVKLDRGFIEEHEDFGGGTAYKHVAIFERIEDNTYWEVTFYESSDGDCHELKRKSWYDKGEFIEGKQVFKKEVIVTKYE